MIEIAFALILMWGLSSLLAIVGAMSFGNDDNDDNDALPSPSGAHLWPDDYEPYDEDDE